MIQVMKNNELRRNDIIVGWLRDNYVYDHTDKKIGYFSGQNIFNIAGKRIAYIYGEFLILVPSDQRIRLEDNNAQVSGVISDVARATIRLLLG